MRFHINVKYEAVKLITTQKTFELRVHAELELFNI